MRVRRFGAGRCPGCRMHTALCICAQLPVLPTRTRVVLVLHQAELHKTTNTGRLALSCLPSSALALRGRPTGPAALPGAPPAIVTERPMLSPAPGWLGQMPRPVLLYPHPEAAPLDHFRDGDPVTLIVPDGTWSQAVRTRKRIPDLDRVPCAHLPDGLISQYRLRHAPHAGQVSTLEAIAHALGILEDPGLREALLAVQRLMTERTLQTRGYPPDGR
jgi:DTW domain-containing protein YfiP